VEDFVKRIKDPASVSLRRVRFTNFDVETTTIFEKEFVSRYLKPTLEAVPLAKAQSAPADPKAMPENKPKGGLFNWLMKK
jgi:hypothetical protein